MMDMVVEEERAIFENAGQAVHVAFLVMSQPAMQDAPFRKALIRVMESIKLVDGNQRNWLDQLRGERSGNINFEGLSGADVRAQCALITQAVVTNLPPIERWVLQAKYGRTDFEDFPAEVGEQAIVALERVRADVLTVRDRLSAAQARLSPWTPGGGAASRELFEQARDDVKALRAQLEEALRLEQRVQVAYEQSTSVRSLDNGPAPKAEGGAGRRRFAFSPERIQAIQNLTDYFAPMLPRINTLAIDCMLGRMFANHKKIEISTRDLADQFGGSHMKYMRASCKMKNHVRVIEQSAVARLEPVFIEHGVVARSKEML